MNTWLEGHLCNVLNVLGHILVLVLSGTQWLASQCWKKIAPCSGRPECAFAMVPWPMNVTILSRNINCVTSPGSRCGVERNCNCVAAQCACFKGSTTSTRTSLHAPRIFKYPLLACFLFSLIASVLVGIKLHRTGRVPFAIASNPQNVLAGHGLLRAAAVHATNALCTVDTLRYTLAECSC